MEIRTSGPWRAKPRGDCWRACGDCRGCSGVVARRPWGARAPGTATVIPVGEDLTGLSADQLREAIHSLDQPLAEEGAGSVDAGLEGLSADELRALLHALES